MGEVSDGLVAKIEQHVADKNIAPAATTQEQAVESSSEKPTPPVEKLQVEVIPPQEDLQELPVDDEILTYAQSLTNEKESKEIASEKDSKNVRENENGKKENVLTPEQASQLEQARLLLSDKRLIQFKEFLDKGGNLIDFAKNIVGEDTSKISDEQLHNEYLASLNLSPEELTTEQESFASKTRLEKAALVKPFRDQRKAEQEKKANEFINSVPDQRAQVSQAAEKAIQELNTLKEQYVGKKVDGVLMSDTTYNEIVSDLISGAIPAIPKMVNGQFAGYDVAQSIEMAHLWKNRNLIKRQHIEIGRTMGWNEYHKKRIRPSTQPTGSIPVTEETVADAMKALHENKNNFSLSESQPYQSSTKDSKAI